MTMYITKYALSSGVFQIEKLEVDDGMLVAACTEGLNRRVYFHKPYWHETEEEAMNQVRLMVSRRRKSIQKELEKLDFIESELDKGILPGGGK